MVEIQLHTPLAEALKQGIERQLSELGGDRGADDLADYVVLMLVNGKTPEEINTETTELLSLPPNDPNVQGFIRWLFEEINTLSAQHNGSTAAAAPVASTELAMEGTHQEDYSMDGNFDASMTEGSNELNAPTGPKSMQGGGNFRGGREKRMVGQINRALDRTLDPLHRTRGNTGVGRNPPSGPRMGAGRQPRGNANFATHITAGINAHGMPGMPPLGPRMNGMNGGMNPAMSQNWGGMPSQSRTAQEMMAIMEQQQMMIQMLAQSQGQAPMMPNGGAPYGRPLSERIQKPYQQNNFRGRGGTYQPNGHHQYQNHNKPHFNGQSHFQTSDAIKTEGSNGSDKGDVDMAEGQGPAKHDAPVEETMCYYNLRCTNPECKFAHQSPAAPPGTTVDPSDVCTFGAACKNRKCVGRHPSPAKKITHMGETDCKFFPNCTNPHCPFRHPTMPPCRNGGECKVPNCKFTHVKTACKFNPCTNRYCPFSHEDGQRGTFPDKVWKADGSKEHVSERKFVDDQTPEKVILPEGAGGGDQEMNGTGNDVAEPQDVIV